MPCWRNALATVLIEYSIRMNAKLIILIFVNFSSLCFGDNIKSVSLPCEFSFDSKFGYTCRVGGAFESLTNTVNISEVIGKHIRVNDKLPRHDFDVFRVMFYDHRIAFLPASITLHFTKLRTLHVKKCGLKELTRAPNFHSLRRMYLGFNEIKNIPSTYFWHFCRLEILSLFHNQISTIPQIAFRDLISLRRLSLNGNRLKSIDPHLFVRCLILEFIDLDNNALESIEGDLFTNQTRLTKISMRNNQITFIGSEFLVENINNNNASVIALLGGNQCIADFSLPHDGNFERLQEIFVEKCSMRPITTTTPPPPTTQAPRSKQKYKPKSKLYFDYCKWHVLKGFEYLYSKSF